MQDNVLKAYSREENLSTLEDKAGKTVVWAWPHDDLVAIAALILAELSALSVNIRFKLLC